jgi:hypothetical protein
MSRKMMTSTILIFLLFLFYSCRGAHKARHEVGAWGNVHRRKGRQITNKPAHNHHDMGSSIPCQKTIERGLAGSGEEEKRKRKLEYTGLRWVRGASANTRDTFPLQKACQNFFLQNPNPPGAQGSFKIKHSQKISDDESPEVPPPQPRSHALCWKKTPRPAKQARDIDLRT